MIEDRPDHCRGCGQRPEEFPPNDAVASLRLLQRRSTALARRPRSRDAVQHEPADLAATDAAARIPAVLASADRRLHRLFAEPQPPPPVPVSPTGAGIATSLASVADTADRLVRTITGATAEDWYHCRPDQDVSAAEVTWLALHEATHQLEDVELALNAATVATKATAATIYRFPGRAQLPIDLATVTGRSYPSTLVPAKWRRDRPGGDDAC